MGEGTSESGGGKAGLQLPAQVTIALASAGGPFARGSLDAGRAKVSLVNGAATRITIGRVILTPLADAGTGLAPPTTNTALSAEVDKPQLDPGEATTIEITGTVPARPGSYMARLEVVYRRWRDGGRPGFRYGGSKCGLGDRLHASRVVPARCGEASYRGR